MATEWTWQPVPTTRNWVLVDGEGKILREVVAVGPYLGESREHWAVNDAGNGPQTRHPTLDEAKVAAEAAAKAALAQ